MILAVDEVGYADAVAAFRAGNRAAASVVSPLVADLAGTGSMAGTDSGAADFAAAYDAAAGEALDALTDVTRALATLGRTTAACDRRHREAERAAIVPGAVVDPGCSPPPDDVWLAPLPSNPPSALGGDSPALSPQENWILDQVGGLLWPDGSPTRLRAAATAWRAAGQSLLGLADSVAVAGDALLSQRSPEIPLAVAACDDVRRVLRSLADDCGSLVAQCEGYAAAIEAAHAALRALLVEVLMMVVEGMVVSAALAVVSAGAGAAAGLAAVAARVATTAPRFHRILSALRTARTGYTAAVRATHTTLTAARTRLSRFLRVPVRGERGAIKVVPGDPRSRVRELLRRSENGRGHTLSRHVGKSQDELGQRLHDNARLSKASTFDDALAAERHIEAALRMKSDEIEQWLRGGDPRETFPCPLGKRTGITMFRSGEVVDAQGVFLVLQRDASMPEGYHIVSAFPQP